MTVAADLRDWKLVCLRPVDADGNVSIGGAEFLVESTVGADPQVVLCDFHLENQQHNNWPQKPLGSRNKPNYVQLLTAQRKPEPGMESKPSSSLVMEIM